MDQAELFKKIMAIQQDSSLTEEEKGRRRQALLAGKWAAKPQEEEEEKEGEPKHAPGGSLGRLITFRSSTSRVWHALASPAAPRPPAAPAAAEDKGKAPAEETADVLGEHLKCTICHDVCERPVTVRGVPWPAGPSSRGNGSTASRACAGSPC